jgi:hypothetical protein
MKIYRFAGDDPGAVKWWVVTRKSELAIGFNGKVIACQPLNLWSVPRSRWYAEGHSWELVYEGDDGSGGRT